MTLTTKETPCIVRYMTSIWLIQRNYDYRDQDNYACTDVELDDDEGFFLTEQAAEARCAELDSHHIVAYETALAHSKSMAEIRENHYQTLLAQVKLIEDSGQVYAGPKPQRERDYSGPVPATLQEYISRAGNSYHTVVELQAAPVA